MLRIKCPHCGAGNQDATETDTCWQCGTVLGAPVARMEEARSNAPSASAPTQQLDPTLLNQLTDQSQRTRPASQANQTRQIAVLAVVLAVIAIILLVAVLATKG